MVILFPSILSTVPFKFARSPSATSTTSPVAKLCLSSSSPSFKLFTGTKKKRIYVEIQPTWFRITLSSYLPCSWISRHLVLFLVTKWREILIFKTLFLLCRWTNFKKIFTFGILVVSYFRNYHQISYNAKNKIWRELCDLIYPPKMPKSENQKNHTILRNGVFYIVANFQVNCIKTKKRWMKVSVFYVTYAHHVREKTFIHSGIILTQEITSLAPLVNL